MLLNHWRCPKTAVRSFLFQCGSRTIHPAARTPRARGPGLPCQCRSSKRHASVSECRRPLPSLFLLSRTLAPSLQRNLYWQCGTGDVFSLSSQSQWCRCRIIPDVKMTRCAHASDSWQERGGEGQFTAAAAVSALQQLGMKPDRIHGYMQIRIQIIIFFSKRIRIRTVSKCSGY